MFASEMGCILPCTVYHSPNRSFDRRAQPTWLATRAKRSDGLPTPEDDRRHVTSAILSEKSRGTVRAQRQRGTLGPRVGAELFSPTNFFFSVGQQNSRTGLGRITDSWLCHPFWRFYWPIFVSRVCGVWMRIFRSNLLLSQARFFLASPKVAITDK
jgi:hypothetical protein